jgi:hypothetical protein
MILWSAQNVWWLLIMDWKGWSGGDLIKLTDFRKPRSSAEHKTRSNWWNERFHYSVQKRYMNSLYVHNLIYQKIYFNITFLLLSSFFMFSYQSLKHRSADHLFPVSPHALSLYLPSPDNYNRLSEQICWTTPGILLAWEISLNTFIRVFVLGTSTMTNRIYVIQQSIFLMLRKIVAPHKHPLICNLNNFGILFIWNIPWRWKQQMPSKCWNPSRKPRGFMPKNIVCTSFWYDCFVAQILLSRTISENTVYLLWHTFKE